MYKRKRKGKKKINSKKNIVDGITFASSLEAYCYERLKEGGLYEGYENEVFHLMEAFHFPNESHERQANGKGDMVDRGDKKVLGIKYTPDFCGKDYIIETKGFANPTFSFRWKLFKLWLVQNDDSRILYKPQNRKEVDKVIELIKTNRKDAL